MKYLHKRLVKLKTILLIKYFPNYLEAIEADQLRVVAGPRPSLRGRLGAHQIKPK